MKVHLGLLPIAISPSSSSKFKNVQQQEGSEVIGELTPHPQFVELKQTHMASH